MANHSARAPNPPVRTGDVAMAAPPLSAGAWRHRRRAILLGFWPGALCLAWACAGGPDRHHAPVAVEHGPDGGAPAAGHPRTGAHPAGGSNGSALTEATARALLAERFRAAGLRVRYDVQVVRDGAFALTVDGYDPARRVGFEYVAEGEAGADLDPGERTALARDREQRILIIDAAGAAPASGAAAAGEADQADRIGALAERFLQALETPRSQ
jgi:hypothetical protein